MSALFPVLHPSSITLAKSQPMFIELLRLTPMTATGEWFGCYRRGSNGGSKGEKLGNIF